jgi:hypothetical protein
LHRILMSLLPVFVFGCGPIKRVIDGDAKSERPSAQSKVDGTSYADVKPIIDQKCAQCHREGDIAPFPLTEFQHLKDRIAGVTAAIESKSMPPWPPKSGCNDYKNDPSLTPEEMAKFFAFRESGSPFAEPQESSLVEKAGLEKPDEILMMLEPYTMNQKPDDYRCFVLEFSPELPIYVTGFNTLPDNREIVHHVIAYVALGDQDQHLNQLLAEDSYPGYECFGGPRLGKNTTSLGGWAPGGQGGSYPEGTGIKLEPGSKIIMQVHYNSEGTNGEDSMIPQIDQSSIELSIAAEVVKEAFILPIVNPLWVQLPETMAIPAGQADVIHSFSYPPSLLTGGKGVTVYTANLHMHNLGRSGRLTLKGEEDVCLLEIEDWDFAWQMTYDFVEPIHIEPGQYIEVECHFDNSQANQPKVNGEIKTPVDTFWGEGSNDEMCIGFLYGTAD